jgi:hypothetical protein
LTACDALVDNYTLENPKGTINNGYPEKLATKDEEKHNTIPSFKLNLNTIVIFPILDISLHVIKNLTPERIVLRED